MPLNLLQHKSYHVYSTKNIERVRRDEAAARAQEEAKEQRMQEADAEYRMSVLRARAEGRALPPPPPPPSPPQEEEKEAAAESTGDTGSSHRRRRKDYAGDRDKDRDATQLENTVAAAAPPRKAEQSLTGPDGHINLFGGPAPRHAEKKTEEKKGKGEEQYTNGLGRSEDQKRPWYSTLDMVGEEQKAKTEWEERREEKRKDWGDPLAVVRRGVRGIKAVEEERREWRRGREGAGVAALERFEKEGGADRERKRGRSRSPSRGHHEKGRRRKKHRSHSHSRSRSSGMDRSGHRHGRHSRRHGSTDRRSRHKEEEDIMAKLRRERDAREATERKKTEDMLRKEKEYRTPGWTAADGGRYSSQFGVGEVRRRAG